MIDGLVCMACCFAVDGHVFLVSVENSIVHERQLQQLAAVHLSIVLFPDVVLKSHSSNSKIYSKYYNFQSYWSACLTNELPNRKNSIFQYSKASISNFTNNIRFLDYLSHYNSFIAWERKSIRTCSQEDDAGLMMHY